MTAPQPQTRREEIDFIPNVPTTVAMKYAQPRMLAGQFGTRFMFTTPDNRVFFLDESVAKQIADLGINTNESFTITKKTSGKKGDPVSWQISKLSTNGSLVIPRETPEPTPATPPRPAGECAPKPPARAERLVEEANELVDAYAEVLDRALKTHQGRVKPDEVRALLISTYIKQTRGAA